MSYNQGDGVSPIRFNPSKDNTYRASNDTTRPIGHPKANKDFKKIYRDDRKKGDDEETMEVGDASEGTGQIAANDLKIGKTRRPGSIFDLPSQGSPNQSKSFTNKGRAIPQAELPGETTSDDSTIAEAINDSLTTGGHLSEVAEANPQATTDFAKGKKSMMVRGDMMTSEHQSAHVHAKAGSPNDVFAKLSAADAQKIADSEHSFIPSDKKEKFTTRFATEQPDLSYVNPMAPNNQQMAVADVKVEKPASTAADLKALIDQIVDKAYQMELNGRTETTVTLKHPPLFAGANLIITGFDTARGEFNVSFENLTQAAKHVLDLQANQESMRLALEQKGYAVHIITTTTLVERAPIVENPQPGSSQSDRGRRDQDSGGGRQRRDKEG